MMLTSRLMVVMMIAAPVLAEGTNEHAKAVDTRGDKGMGFSHDMVVHHFGLTKNGGFITAEVKEPANAEKAKPMITGHFAHIADAFKDGDFSLPMFIHDRVPPGVPEMKKLKSEIDYVFHETPMGGRIDITTANPRALHAVQRFLAFQIKDHRTGDSTAVAP
jgi:hypothetical protein